MQILEKTMHCRQWNRCKL